MEWGAIFSYFLGLQNVYLEMPCLHSFMVPAIIAWHLFWAVFCVVLIDFRNFTAWKLIPTFNTAVCCHFLNNSVIVFLNNSTFFFKFKNTKSICMWKFSENFTRQLFFTSQQDTTCSWKCYDKVYATAKIIHYFSWFIKFLCKIENGMQQIKV